MSHRIPSLAAKDIIFVLKKLGFVEDRQKGSHKVFIRAADQRAVVVPWHSGDLKQGTIRSIIKKAGLSVEEFLRHL
jgi:predicted RNA binding protein YcfA (HicA-like mRNA interferase family)